MLRRRRRRRRREVGPGRGGRRPGAGGLPAAAGRPRRRDRPGPHPRPRDRLLDPRPARARGGDHRRGVPLAAPPLDRLAEEGLEVVRVAAEPVETLAERLAAAVDDRTCLVGVSAVLFMSARIVPDLAAVVLPASPRRRALVTPTASDRCRSRSTTSVCPTRGHRWRVQVPPARRGQRLPPGAAARPRRPTDRHRLVRRVRRPHADHGPTSSTDRRRAGSPAAPRPGEQLPGSPASSASSTSTGCPAFLREVYQHQLRVLVGVRAARPAGARRARPRRAVESLGFLALRAPNAGDLQRSLLARGMFTDSRADILRRTGAVPVRRPARRGDDPPRRGGEERS